ncbi:hypothetical protein ACFL1X_06000 [Candidatus Hydrogenedentota bacterium]
MMLNKLKKLIAEKLPLPESIEEVLRFEFHSRAERDREHEIVLFLVEDGVLSEDQVLEATEEEKRTGRLLLQILMEGRHVSERQVTEAIARKHGLPLVHPEQTPSQKAALDCMPYGIAARNKIIPIGLDGNRLFILTSRILPETKIEILNHYLAREMRQVISSAPFDKTDIKMRYSGDSIEEMPHIPAVESAGPSATEDTEASKPPRSPILEEILGWDVRKTRSSSARSKAEQRRRKRYCLLILFACLLIVSITCNLKYGADMDEQLDALREAGYPVTMDELALWNEGHRKGENAAELYSRAFGAFVKPSEELVARLPFIGVAKLPEPEADLSEEMLTAIEQHLVANEEALGMLYLAVGEKEIRFPLNFENGMAMKLPHLAPCRSAARLISMAAIYHTEKGDADEACKALESGLAIPRSLVKEPPLISQSIRIACNAICVEALERAVNRTSFTDSQLQRLDDALALGARKDASSLTRGLLIEVCFANGGCGNLFPYLYQSRLKEPSKLSGFLSRTAMRCYDWLGLYEWDMDFYLERMRALIEESKTPLYESENEYKKFLQVMEERGWRSGLISGTILWKSFRAGYEEARDTALVSSARTALAVERYRLMNDRLPASLEDVGAPHIMEDPIDPFTGNSLRLKVTDRGYRVYSVGHNLIDDGGEWGRGFREGDIVFLWESDTPQGHEQ